MFDRMPPMDWYFKVEPNFKPVSKDEFDEFLRTYPRRLIFDSYQAFAPSLLTWNDSELADRWPFTIVARTYGYDEYGIPEERRHYYIMENISEVFASRTGRTREDWERMQANG